MFHLFQVYIAQREFEHAANLVFKGRDFCRTHGSDNPLVREAAEKLEAKRSLLLDALRAELASEKSIQGGPRAARRAVTLLAEMGRSAEACNLFLKHRSAILNSSMK